MKRSIVYLSIMLIFLYSAANAADVISLEKCIDLSRKDNLNVKQSMSGLEIQKRKVRQANLRKLPTGTAYAEFANKTYNDNHTWQYHSYIFEIVQPFYHFGEYRYLSEREKAKSYSALMALLETSLNSEKDATLAYMDAMQAIRVKMHIEDLREFINTYYETAKKLVAQGKKPKEALDRIQVIFSQLDTEELTQEYTFETAVAALSKAINHNYDKKLKILPFEIIEDFDINSQQISTLNTSRSKEEINSMLYRYSETFSPSWIKNKFDIAASEYNLSYTRTSTLPKIGLVAHWEREDDTNNYFIQLGVRANFLFLSASDWEENSIQKEEVNKTKIGRDIFERDRKYNIDTSFQKLASLAKQADISIAQVTKSRAYMKKTAELYAQGKASEVEFTDACTSYDTAQKSRINFLFTFFRQRRDFLNYLGQSMSLQTPTLEDFSRKKIEDLGYNEKHLFFDYFFIQDMRAAISNGDYNQAKKQIENYKEVLGDAPYGGWEVLHFAAFWGAKEIALQSIQNRDDVNKASLSGETPLLHAAAQGEREIVDLLLGHGANPNIHANQERWTPLTRAANKNALEICQSLISHGADINAQTRSGRTALHNASQQGDFEMVKLLVNAGADVMIKTNNGRTAEDIAALEGYNDIEDYFESRKPKTDSKTVQIPHVEDTNK